jgi:hypothetical protein
MEWRRGRDTTLAERWDAAGAAGCLDEGYRGETFDR